MKRALLFAMFAGAVLAQTKSTPAPVAKGPGPTPAAGDLLRPSTLNATAPAVFRAKLTTTKGDVVIEVTRALSPRGADRFYNLVRAGFFTDCAFYRVIPKFMAQFGISARPEVTKALKGANILDEPAKESNRRGMVTFATSGPNTRSNTFFINTVDNGYLDPMGFTPFGRVIEGMEIVDMLYSGYGDISSRQLDFENGGKAYVDRTFPKLDRILTATIVAVPPPAAK